MMGYQTFWGRWDPDPLGWGVAGPYKHVPPRMLSYQIYSLNANSYGRR